MRLLVAFNLLLLLPHAPAAEFPPADHSGADMVLVDGDVVWGTHDNVGLFHIPAGAVISVRAYHPDQAHTGTLTIQADHIEILGTLTATAAGYSGGSGGGGGGGGQTLFNVQGPGGQGGAVPYEMPGMRGENGANPLGFQGGAGGSGGNGDGPQGGTGGTLSNPHGLNGEYSSVYGPTEQLQMGSGGGGGAGQTGSVGHNEGAYGGRGGGAGGRGGGMIALQASSAFILGDAALIEANGALGPQGNLGSTSIFPYSGGNGGSAAVNIHTPYIDIRRGGAGSGGGIALNFATTPDIQIAPTAAIRAVGGNDQTSNGGVVKILSPIQNRHLHPSQISALHLFDLSPAAVGAVWQLYQ